MICWPLLRLVTCPDARNVANSKMTATAHVLPSCEISVKFDRGCCIGASLGRSSILRPCERIRKKVEPSQVDVACVSSSTSHGIDPATLLDFRRYDAVACLAGKVECFQAGRWKVGWCDSPPI